jgi:cyclohexadieny/prephenate dehydrogenase / 3-phosphoshikimate 1-carboxyvinyltransferase
MSTSLVSSIGVIGLGLIGGSFARALKLTHAVESVFGFDLRSSEVNAAIRLGVIDVACPDIEYLVVRSKVIVLATPVKTVEPLLREISPYLTEEHVITDMGSVKGAVVSAVERVFGKVIPGFVPGHPIAGSEKSGVAAAVADLFKDHKTILTPVAGTSANALDIVARLWRATGAQVLMMSPNHHDEVLAATSHLPHLIAFSLVDTLAGADDNKDIFRYAAGGFRDFTRIAASDPVMWHDIYLSNRQAVLKAVDEFSKDLAKLRHAIDMGDGETLLGVFTRAKAARDYFGKMLTGTGYTTQDITSSTSILVARGLPLKGDIRLSGDKSISHRIIVLGSLAKGVTRVEGFHESEASLATVQAFRDMGVVIEGPDRGQVVIHGVGLHGLSKPAGPLYIGHSDTSMRLLSGVMSGQSFSSEIVGDHSHRHKPMFGIIEVLSSLGAKIEVGDDGLPPVVVKGKQTLKGCELTLHEVNAEVKTCLLLAAIFAEGKTVICESHPTRDHSERLLAGFGYPLQIAEGRVSLYGQAEITAQALDLPTDFTLACYFIVAATIEPGSDLTLRHVGINPTRVRALSVLLNMGANIEIFNQRQIANELVADVRIRATALLGFEIGIEDCLQASEEVPALLVAACFASTPSRINGFKRLPKVYKEFIQPLVKQFMTAGIKISFAEDDMVVGPDWSPQLLEGEMQAPEHPGAALACILIANCSEGYLQVNNCADLISCYPEIIAVANEIGFKINRLTPYDQINTV